MLECFSGEQKTEQPGGVFLKTEQPWSVFLEQKTEAAWLDLYSRFG